MIDIAPTIPDVAGSQNPQAHRSAKGLTLPYDWITDDEKLEKNAAPQSLDDDCDTLQKNTDK